MFMIPGRRLAETEAIYSDWVYRGGDNAIIRAETFAASDPNTLSGSVVEVTFYTKNSEDTGNGRPIGTSTITLTGVGFGEIDLTSTFPSSGTPATGILEMLRVRVKCTSKDWSTVRVFDPVFYDLGQ